MGKTLIQNQILADLHADRRGRAESVTTLNYRAR
jgi:hypothetical protein